MGCQHLWVVALVGVHRGLVNVIIQSLAAIVDRQDCN